MLFLTFNVPPTVVVPVVFTVEQFNPPELLIVQLDEVDEVDKIVKYVCHECNNILTDEQVEYFEETYYI